MIEINQVIKTFGPVKALDGVSFSVRRGEVLGFLGPNGAGKTTTMKLICGFYEPAAGKITINGLDTVSQSLAVRRLIGYLPETVPLYQDMKVYEYLKFVAEIRDVEPDKFVSRLREVVEKCGLQKVVGKNIDELSKGFRQRVGLAQAIIHDPDILILDEPTTGLDPNQIGEIRDLIKQIGREKTVLLSTHILTEVQNTCDRVVIINHGRIVREGRPEELTSRLAAATVFYLKTPIAVAVATEQLLTGLSTVKEMRRVADEESGVVSYEIVAADETARQSIAETLVRAACPVLEFTKKTVSLETVFRELTT